jgi:hypothetical protein
MSQAPRFIQDEQVNGVVDVVTSPTIQTPRDSNFDISVTPAATTKLREITTYDAKTVTNVCGDSRTESGDSKPARLVIEGVLVKSQLEQLRSLEDTGGRAYVTSDVLTGTFEFDQFTVTQQATDNTGEFRVAGQTLEGPVFSFQLQAKRETEQ